MLLVTMESIRAREEHLTHQERLRITFVVERGNVSRSDHVHYEAEMLKRILTTICVSLRPSNMWRGFGRRRGRRSIAGRRSV